MFQGIRIGLALAAMMTVAACGSDNKSSSSSGGSSFTCCINGSNYSCPSEAALNKCGPPDLDPSGCSHTGDSADGMCH